MTLQPLRTALETQTAGGAPAQILKALASASMPAPSAVAASLTTQMAVAAELTVNGATVAPGGDSPVVLTGTADVIGLEGATVEVTFTASSNAYPDIQIVVTPAAGWSLGKSFPKIAGTPADTVSLAKPQLVFTTAAATSYTWTDSAGQTHASALSPGLNFVGDLLPTDVLGLLSSVLQGGSTNLHVPMSGTIDRTPLTTGKLSPNINVQGPLGRSLLAAAGFTLGAPAVVIANDPSQTDGPAIIPRVLLSVPVIANGTPLVTVSAPIGGIEKGLSLAVTGANGGLRLEQISSLILGEQITANLPAFLQSAFQTIAFKSFLLELDTPSMKPIQVTVTVGTIEPWGIAEFTVNSTTLAYTLIDPLGTKLAHRWFTANVSIFPQVFTGTFDLVVENGSGQTAVSADYHGTVTLNALISGLTNGRVTIPADLLQVTFSDFGVGFSTTAAGWDWQLYGKANATFSVPMVSGGVEADVVASVTSTGGQRAYQLIGTLAIGNAFFGLEMDLGPTSNVLTGKWQLTGGDSLGFADIAAAVGLPAPSGIPPELDLALISAQIQYQFDNNSLLLSAISKNYGTAIFVAVTSTTPSLYAFGLTIDLGVRLADIPLVGSKIPDGQNLGIDTATIWILSRAATKSEVEVLNARAAAANFPQLPDGDINATVVLAADLKVGTGTPVPLQLTLGGSSGSARQALPAQGPSSASTPSTSTPATVAAPPSSEDSTVWLNVQRQIGPFTFNRVGIGYDAGQLRFALDAGIALGPFALSMDGLSIASPLTSFQPTFDLSGLGISFIRPPLEITGALLKLPGSQLSPLVNYQFDGMVILKTDEFAISGIGSYAQLKSGDPSLFIFAQLEMPLGGPPAFFITGLMAGVGFNRSLVIPGMDQVQAFPLLTLGQAPAPGSPSQKQDPMQVLQILEGAIAGPGGVTQQWIAPKPGSFWFAAGIEFTSFKLANTRAMLIVEDSDELTIALLGLSTIQLPLPAPNTPTYAYAELQIRMVLQPEEGVFMASAVLSNNSYVLTPDCHLTGGFAFGFWFGSNAHAGDFVVTLGGYHPAFAVPSHYPSVPRLGFNWAVSDEVSIKGDAYFALTPSCAMGGGGLEVLFHSGDLNAWFTAHADVLISWKPFFFIAEIDVSVGVSYRLNLLVCHKTISISIGASVELWGPPTGGKVHVHLVVVTFTVRFGSDGADAAAQPLEWPDLKALLPAPSTICNVTAQGTLAGTADSTDSTSQKRWFVRPRGFSFATNSAIPASTLNHTGAPTLKADATTPAASIAIKPMNLTAASSLHDVAVTQGTPTGTPVDTTGWTFSPRTQTVPDALWGAPPVPFSQIPGQPSAKTIPGALVGYTVSIPDPTLGSDVGAIPFAELLEEYILPAGQSPLSQAVTPTSAYVPSASAATISQIAAVNTGTAFAGRSAIFNALATANVFTSANGTLAIMAGKAGHLFTDAPLQQV